MEDEAAIIEALNGSNDVEVSAACRRVISCRKYSPAISQALERWLWNGSPAIADIVIRAYQHMGSEAYWDLVNLFDRIQGDQASDAPIECIVWGLGLFPDQFADLYDRLSLRVVGYSGEITSFVVACAHTLARVLIQFKATGVAYDKDVLESCKSVLERSFEAGGSAAVVLRDMQKAGLF
jgi:hypothetical protein